MATFSHLGVSRLTILIISIGGLLVSSLLLQKALTNQHTEVAATKKVKPTPKPTAAPSLTQVQAQNASYLREFLYPHATTTQQTAEKVTQQTYDQPLLITNWYKNQLNQHAFTTTTVIQTNTNDTIENKLVGVKDDKTIAIAISKQPSEGVTYIEVSSR